jgi:putative holliday junction resolvase
MLIKRYDYHPVLYIHPIRAFLLNNTIFALHKTKMGRILAIDYGRKRTGVAVTDTLQIIAGKLETVSSSEIFSFLKAYMQKEEVEKIIVGYPLQMNNEASEAVLYINPFLKRLVKEFPEIPVEQVDERFTSKMAFQTMIDAGLKKKDRQNKATIDAVSATIMLQSYLEQKKYRK